jgi:hypothetical protein
MVYYVIGYWYVWYSYKILHVVIMDYVLPGIMVYIPYNGGFIVG